MSEMSWHYNGGGKKAGPVSQSQLCELFARGQLPIETMVWSGAVGTWVAASTIAGFRAAACSAPKATIVDTNDFQNAVAFVAPAPRKAQLTDRAWGLRAAILALLVIVPLGLDTLLARARQRNAIVERPTLTTGGLVTRKFVDTVHDRGVCVVAYSFVANGKEYRRQEYVSPARFDATGVQQPVTVTYDVGNPRQSTIDPNARRKPADAAGATAAATAAALTARRIVLGSFGALCGCLFLLEHRIRKQRFLCSQGAASQGRVTDHRRRQSRYAFTTQDGQQFVHTFVRSGHPLGAPLTILYDPNNPKCSQPLEIMRLAKVT